MVYMYLTPERGDRCLILSPVLLFYLFLFLLSKGGLDTGACLLSLYRVCPRTTCSRRWGGGGGLPSSRGRII